MFVSPRHPVGTTGIGDPGLEPLPALGWELRRDDLANVYVTAPDRKVRLGYLPEGDDDGLWRINAYNDPFGPPTWGVCFNDRVPVEFVQAFTTALATAYEHGPDTYLTAPDPGHANRDPFLAVVPLIDRGWQFEHPRWNVFAIQSPDKLACLEFTTGNLNPEVELTTRDARWHLWAGESVDRPASPGGADAARRTAGCFPPPGRPARGGRSALEHHQPPGPARPTPIAPARYLRGHLRRSVPVGRPPGPWRDRRDRPQLQGSRC